MAVLSSARVISVCVPWKSKRVWISFFVWLSALSSSARLIFETTSNEGIRRAFYHSSLPLVRRRELVGVAVEHERVRDGDGLPVGRGRELHLGQGLEHALLHLA